MRRSPVNSTKRSLAACRKLQHILFASYLGRRQRTPPSLSTCVTVMLRAISVIRMGFSVDNYMLDPAQVRQCDDFVAPANEPPTSFSESPPTLR